MRDLSLNFIILCLILCGCVSNGSSGEYDYNMEMLRGKWGQPHAPKRVIYYLEFSDDMMKLYYYDDTDKINYLINGSYIINEKTVTAKDLLSGSDKEYPFEIITCDLIFFDSYQTGFKKIK